MSKWILWISLKKLEHNTRAPYIYPMGHTVHRSSQSYHFQRETMGSRLTLTSLNLLVSAPWFHITLCSRVPLQCSSIYYDILYCSTVIGAEHKFELVSIKYTLYLAFLDELRGVCCDNYGEIWQCFNPLRAKFFRGNINIYLHFVSFLHIDMTQVLKILPHVRPGPTYST